MYPCKAIREHIDPEDRSSLECLTKGGLKRTPLRIIKRLEEMCINTKYSMSIIEKVFKYEATELSVIKYEDEIWFKAVVVATILKYTNQRKAILDHVDPEGKRKLSGIGGKIQTERIVPFKNRLSKRK